MLQAVLSIMAIITGVFVYRTQVVSPDIAAGMGLPRTSIAVLPFEDVSSRGDIAYVADGITDALIAELGDVRALDVISKTGVSQFRNTSLRSDSIARILSVGTIITGTVDHPRADLLRITTRLIDGVGGVDLDRAILEIPAAQFLAATDSVAGAVSQMLRRQLGAEVRVRELQAGTTNQDAWALAQRADRIASDAEDNFERGAEPSSMIRAYQLADSLLAVAESLDPRWGRLPAARAQTAYRRAWVAVNTNDLPTAEREIEVGVAHADRAISMDSGNALALEQRGTLIKTVPPVDCAESTVASLD
jgi:TolB-like protein